MDEHSPEASEPSLIELLVNREYDSCHPGDSFEDLKRRARFSKEDKGLLADWLNLARQRHSAMRPHDKA